MLEQTALLAAICSSLMVISELIVVAMVADFRGESGKEDELGLKKLSNISWSLRDSADLDDW